MSGDRSTAWVDGRIVDAWPLVPRPWSLVAALASLVAALDLALGLAAGGIEADRRPPESPEALRAVLAEAQAEGKGTYLLVGDSVLAGDVLAGRVDGWERERVVEHMRRELAPGAAATFHQVAFDGLLLTDVERIVEELDRVDPKGRVTLVLEVNLRFFSTHYAGEAGCSRPWICDLGERPVDADLRGLAAAAIRDLHHRAAPWVPIARHAERLGLGRGLAEARERPVAKRAERAEAAAEREAADVARIREHYRAGEFGDDSAQVQAFERILARLAGGRRRALLFTTPLNEAVLGDDASPATVGARHAALAERVHRVDASGERVRLVPLDHPIFTPDRFVDHCHLTVEGSRILALNLLDALNLGLARRPRALEAIRPEGPHTTLVAGLGQGYAEGASWEARFREPNGIAWDPEGRQLVIADTGNHVLRRLRADLQTTELLAGVPGFAGRRDGGAGEANLARPRHPCVDGEDVFFVDGGDAVLRQVHAGEVTTRGSFPRHLRRIRCGEGEVIGLGADSRLHVLEVASGRRQDLSFAPMEGEEVRLKDFAIGPAGRIFAVTQDNRILEARRGEGSTLALTTIFAGVGEETTPRGDGDVFPYDFDHVRFASIQDLVYVERYDGILVQDEVPPAEPLQALTERVHLRFLDLEARKVYPWVKPEVFGQSYVLWNDTTRSLVSGYHQGSLALDAGSASLFYLERRRSRLYRIDDGILGVAKTGHFSEGLIRQALPDRLGSELGRRAQVRWRPQEHLDERWEDQPRKGPYLGLLVGSSMIAHSDVVGEYSLGRKIEQVLSAELGYRDRIRFDLFQRTESGASLPKMIETLLEAEEQGLRVDVALLDVYALIDRFLEGSPDEAALLGHLRELEAYRRRTGALVVFLNNTALGSRRIDGMRAPNQDASVVLDRIGKAGFPIVDPTDRLVHRHLDYSTWGNPPFAREFHMHHGSVWGIEITGELFAELLYPHVRAYAAAHGPRHRAPVGAGKARAVRPLVVDALAGAPRGASLPAIDRRAIQIRYAEGHLRLFLDRKALDEGASEAAIALAALHEALVGDVYGGLASEVTVEIAAFADYNEYGAGTLSSATILWQRTMDKEGVAALVAEVKAQGGGEVRPRPK